MKTPPEEDTEVEEELEVMEEEEEIEIIIEDMSNRETETMNPLEQEEESTQEEKIETIMSKIIKSIREVQGRIQKFLRGVLKLCYLLDFDTTESII